MLIKAIKHRVKSFMIGVWNVGVLHCRTLRTGIAAFLTLAILQGCSTPGATPGPSGGNNHQGSVPAQEFAFDDGGSALFYTLDKTVRADGDAEARPEPPATLLFFVSGSGCTSMQYFLPGYFRGLEGESGPIRIHVLQKRFIGRRSWGRLFGCPPDFLRADHLSRWVADQHAFIVAQIGIAQASQRMPRRIVIAGASEGAEIVPLLARRIQGVTHAVMIGNGGMQPMEAYRRQLLRHGVPNPFADPHVLQERPGDPDSPQALIAGHTWRYWSELQALAHIENLLALEVPLWVAMGERDDAVPEASALYLQEQFALHGKANLVLEIHPDADHQLRANSAANLVDFWFRFDAAMAR